eukprot:Gb_23203 [translate_table: standard]
MFRDAFKRVRSCAQCQKFVGKPKFFAMPLHPVKADKPFEQWDLDFIGPITPNSSAGHKFILTTIDYFTRWSEAVATKRATSGVVIEFLQQTLCPGLAFHLASFQTMDWGLCQMG